MKTTVIKCVAFAIFALLIPLASSAQTKKEAVDAYNSGASVIKDNPKQALELLYQALQISEDLEIDGEETKVLAESLIPTAHFNLAMSFYKEKKMNETLEQLEKARETAKQFFDKNTQSKAERLIPQLYNQMGTIEYKNDKLEKAIEYFNKAIDIKKDYPDPYLGIALSKEKMDDYDGMLEYLKQTLEVAKSTNDRGKTEDALKKANSYLLTKAQEFEKGKDYSQAIAYYEKYLEFDSTDIATRFKIGENSLSIKNWDQAIDSFSFILEKNNSTLDPSLINYQLGVAYQGKNLKSQACEAFKRAMSGQYLEHAKYQIEEVLKCE